MLLGTLGTSLLGSLLAGQGVIQAVEGLVKIFNATSSFN